MSRGGVELPWLMMKAWEASAATESMTAANGVVAAEKGGTRAFVARMKGTVRLPTDRTASVQPGETDTCRGRVGGWEVGWVDE